MFGDPRNTWADLAWVREHWDGPIALKGVLHPDDARRAVDAGMEGIVVSNHGGRQIDGSIAALDALPGVVEAVDGRAEVLFDSGVRTGSDVMKALALGAQRRPARPALRLRPGPRRRGRRAPRAALPARRARPVDGAVGVRVARRCRARAAHPYTVIAWRNHRLALRACVFCACTKARRIHSAAGQPISHRLLDIWDRRDVLRMLIERGLRHKYGSSVLGYAWSLLEPAPAHRHVLPAAQDLQPQLPDVSAVHRVGDPAVAVVRPDGRTPRPARCATTPG